MFWKLCFTIWALIALVKFGMCKDGVEEYYSLFGHENKALTASETLDSLKRIRDTANRPEMKKEATVLAEISELEGCTDAEVFYMNQLFIDNQFHSNIRHYISDVRGKYLDRCSDKFGQSIERDIEALDDETKEAIPVLKSAFEKANTEFGESSPEDSREPVARGLTEYLGTQDCKTCQLIKLKSRVKKSDFREVYEKYIQTTCRKFVFGMKTLSKVFEHSYDPKVARAAEKHKAELALVDYCGMALDRYMTEKVFKVIESAASKNPNAKKSTLDKILQL